MTKVNEEKELEKLRLHMCTLSVKRKEVLSVSPAAVCTTPGTEPICMCMHVCVQCLAQGKKCGFVNLISGRSFEKIATATN